MAIFKLVRLDGGEQNIVADHHTVVDEILTFWEKATEVRRCYVVRLRDVATLDGVQLATHDVSGAALVRGVDLESVDLTAPSQTAAGRERR